MKNGKKSPCAWIVVNNRKGTNLPNDRGRKRIYSNNRVFLKNGQEFEVELFNPLKKTVSVRIAYDGKPIPDSGFVLRPGQRFYLDCDMQDKKRFIFKTYDVENTQESKEAIVDNGKFEIYFYPEKIKPINSPKIIFNTNNTGSLYLDNTTANISLSNFSNTSTYGSDCSISNCSTSNSNNNFNSKIETGKI